MNTLSNLYSGSRTSKNRGTKNNNQPRNRAACKRTYLSIRTNRIGRPKHKREKYTRSGKRK